MSELFNNFFSLHLLNFERKLGCNSQAWKTNKQLLKQHILV